MVQSNAKTEKQLKEQKEIMKRIESLYKKIDVPFTGDQFSGLIRKLCYGNPINAISEKIIEVADSSVIDDKQESLPMHAIEYDKDSYFYSSNVQNSWIMFDFKIRKVSISHYSIQTNNFGDSGHWHLQNWCIERSNTNSNWKSLDTHTNDKSLDHKNVSKTCPITNMSSNEFYRYIKLRQTDVNTRGNHAILLSSIEFFGSIIT